MFILGCKHFQEKGTIINLDDIGPFVMVRSWYNKSQIKETCSLPETLPNPRAGTLLHIEQVKFGPLTLISCLRLRKLLNQPGSQFIDL